MANTEDLIRSCPWGYFGRMGIKTGKGRLTFLIGLLLIFFIESAHAATYYVSTTGSGSTCSSASPCGTISAALGKMTGGDTLIVKNGTYLNNGKAMMINDYVSTAIPSGRAGAYTTIKAETPHGVRIKTTGVLDYYDSAVFLTKASYVHIDGFIFETLNSSDPEYVVAAATQHNKFTRLIVKRSHVNAYGGWFASGADYNLFEDCAGVGAARYGFYVGGPDDSTKYNIFRRCVGRMDFAATDQPKATFAIYGNNSTTSVSNHLFQNCIAIDGHAPSGGEKKYGAFYHPKNASNVFHQGCIVLNENVGYAGMFIQEWGKGIQVTNSVVWNLPSSSGASAVRANTCGSMIASYMTLGGTLSGGYYYGGCSDTNSLHGGTPANIVNNAPGAVVMKRYGVSGTLWGDAGYDTLTSEDLWPFPGEDAIKAVFSEQLDTPSGYSPASNVSARGFCTGKSKDGTAQTLTKYIWEYTGTIIPADIYGNRPPAPPTDLRIVE